MSHNQRFRFSLNISSDEYLAYYSGMTRYILTETDTGETIKFPASILRRFLTHRGIHGLFEIEIDENNKMVNICKLDSKAEENEIWL